MGNAANSVIELRSIFNIIKKERTNYPFLEETIIRL